MQRRSLVVVFDDGALIDSFDDLIGRLFGDNSIPCPLCGGHEPSHEVHCEVTAVRNAIDDLRYVSEYEDWL